MHGHLAAAEAPDEQAITEAFWGAAHGNQRAAAEELLGLGADINWVGFDGLTPLDAAQRSGGADLAAWLVENGAVSAAEL
jgi:ankyrin repeat protein